MQFTRHISHLALIAVVTVGVAAVGCGGDDAVTQDGASGQAGAAGQAGQGGAAGQGGQAGQGGAAGQGGQAGQGGAGGAAGQGGSAGFKGTPTHELTTNKYMTAEQMLLANEINESGEPFAEALGYDLDKLDPMKPGVPDMKAYTLGIENYEYSRYQLGTVISRSGIGLHMMWAPLVMKQAAAMDASFDGSETGGTPNGFKEDDVLMKTIKMFGTLAKHAPPGNPWPQFAEFQSGDPRLPQAIDAKKYAWEDFSTLRWDRSKMDKVLNPAAMGQTLMKQYLWAQDMLGSFHDGKDNGIDATGTNSPDKTGSPEFDPTNDIYYGGSGLDGFIGMVLTAESVNKVAFLKGKLAYDGTTLGEVDPTSYDPSTKLMYFPHAVSVTEGQVKAGLPPKATALKVTDPSSQLFDQVSMLWGTSSFVNMMDPSDKSDPAHLAYREVFDGSPFPASMSETGKAGPYDLMKGVSKVIFMNLAAMHFNATDKVFVDEANVAAGKVTRGDKVSMLGSAYLIVALETFAEEFEGTPLKAKAVDAIKAQAAFISTKMTDGSGGFYHHVMLGKPSANGPMNVAAQAAAVRALYVAHRVTGDAGLLTSANAGYARLIKDYYVPAWHAFRSTPGSDDATYTPGTFALLSGALREATLEGKNTKASDIYTNFFHNIASVMQLSEGPATGETGGDSDGDGIPFIPEQKDKLPPIFATQGVFHLTSK